MKQAHHVGFAAGRALLAGAAKASGEAVGAARHVAWYVSYQVHGRTGGGGPRPPRTRS